LGCLWPAELGKALDALSPVDEIVSMRSAFLLFASASALQLPGGPTRRACLIAGELPGGPTRRACLIAGACALLPRQSASASYAMGVAAEQGQSWTATDKALEKAAYDKIDAQLDAKRRYRDDTESNVLGATGDQTRDLSTSTLLC
jgi:hypothetical protein